MTNANTIIDLDTLADAIRLELHNTFPASRPFVCVEGQTIDVEWIDGPSKQAVEAVVADTCMLIPARDLSRVRLHRADMSFGLYVRPEAE